MAINVRKMVDKFFRWNGAKREFEQRGIQGAILPYSLYFNQAIAANANPYTIAASGSITRPASYKNPYSANNGLDDGFGNPFLARNITYSDSAGESNSAFTVMMEEAGLGRYFSNAPVHIQTIGGTALTPASFRYPYIFPSNVNLVAAFNKISGGSVTARMYLNGEMYFPYTTQIQADMNDRKMLSIGLARLMEQRKYVMPFWMTTDNGGISLLNGASGTFFSTIGDHAFEAYALTVWSTGSFKLTIQEVKTKQTLMNGKITKTNGFGDGNFPYILPTTYLVPAGYKLQYKIDNLYAGTNVIYLTIQGRRILAPLSDPSKIRGMLRDIEAPADF